MYRVIIPNLDRRTDRWRWCLETLLEQRVPKEKIERFSAFDAANWSSIDEAHAEAKEQLGVTILPRYLSGGNVYLGNYAWKFTWYTVLLQISRGDEPALLLIDDWAVPFTYDQICRHIEIVNNEACPLAMIQYHWFSHITDGYIVRSRLEQAPELERGFRGPGDGSILFSPLGARRMIDFANAERVEGDDLRWEIKNGVFKRIGGRRSHTPEGVTAAYSVIGDQCGCYSTPDHPKPCRPKPDYVDTRNDRQPPRVMDAHGRKDWILGTIPLPRAFDSHETFPLGFRTFKEGYLQLTHAVAPKRLFGNYAYRSSLLSDNHIAYRMNYAKNQFEVLNTRTPRSVCEIACNDGYMLNRYVRNGIKAVGVEFALLY